MISTGIVRLTRHGRAEKAEHNKGGKNDYISL